MVEDIPIVNQPQTRDSEDAANVQGQWWWSLILAKDRRLGAEQTPMTTNAPKTDNNEPQETRHIESPNAPEPKPKKSKRKRRKARKSIQLEHTDSVHPQVNEAQETSTPDRIVSGYGLSEVIAQKQTEPPNKSNPAHKSAICPVTPMSQDQTPDSQTASKLSLEPHSSEQRTTEAMSPYTHFTHTPSETMGEAMARCVPLGNSHYETHSLRTVSQSLTTRTDGSTHSLLTRIQTQGTTILGTRDPENSLACSGLGSQNSTGRTKMDKASEQFTQTSSKFVNRISQVPVQNTPDLGKSSSCSCKSVCKDEQSQETATSTHDTHTLPEGQPPSQVLPEFHISQRCHTPVSTLSTIPEMQSTDSENEGVKLNSTSMAMLQKLSDFPSQQLIEVISSRKHDEEMVPLPAPEKTKNAEKNSQAVVATSESKKTRKVMKPKIKNLKVSGSDGKAGSHASTHALQNTTPFVLENKRNEEYTSDNNAQKSDLQDDNYSILPHIKETSQSIHHTTTEDAKSSQNVNLDAQLSNDSVGWTIVSRSKKQQSPSAPKGSNKKQIDPNRLTLEPAKSRFHGNSSNSGLTERKTPRGTSSRSNKQTVDNLTAPISNNPDQIERVGKLMIVDTDFPPLPSLTMGRKDPVGKKLEGRKELKAEECEAPQNTVLVINTTVKIEAAQDEEDTSCEPGKSSCENEPCPQTFETCEENVRMETMCIGDKESSSPVLPPVNDESLNAEKKQTSDEEESTVKNQEGATVLESSRVTPDITDAGSLAPFIPGGESTVTMDRPTVLADPQPRIVSPRQSPEQARIVQTDVQPTFSLHSIRRPHGGFFWQLDSTGFPCAMDSCEKVCNSWDGASVICPRCGPFSEVRYCNAQHLYADIKFHWSRCGEKTFRYPCQESTIPWSQIEGPPLLPNRFNWDTPERHRQAVYHAANRSGDYFIFADWAEFLAAGQPVDDLAVRCSSDVVAVVRISDPTEKDKFRRVLGVCLFGKC